MTTTRDAVRVDSPGALCAMLPHLCGFTPSESLALVWMHGGSVVVTQRIDVDALDLDTAALAATIPAHASQVYSRNVLTLLQHLATQEGALRLDPADEIAGPMLVVHQGKVRGP